MQIINCNICRNTAFKWKLLTSTICFISCVILSFHVQSVLLKSKKNDGEHMVISGLRGSYLEEPDFSNKLVKLSVRNEIPQCIISKSTLGEQNCDRGVVMTKLPQKWWLCRDMWLSHCGQIIAIEVPVERHDNQPVIETIWQTKHDSYVVSFDSSGRSFGASVDAITNCEWFLEWSGHHPVGL